MTTASSATITRRSPRRSAPPKSRETVSWAPRGLGGNGIVADYNVARFFADAEALYSYEGTYQMQNLIVGKAITGLQRLRLVRSRGHANHASESGWFAARDAR
jgi:hypothetical protein